MKIAVLSGKGGTGKTFVSVNLAYAYGKCTYADCDVEEPNGHIFFKPTGIRQHKVSVKIPSVDSGLCTGCRKCVEFCRFNALAYIKGSVEVFEDICHSCGGCSLVCPEAAISERDREIGTVRIGSSGDVEVISGIMNTGEESGVPIIKRLLEEITGKSTVFIDSPPGSSCTVMESIRDADYCILVTEPTVFGLHNLKMVLELVKVFEKPHGIVINKSTGGFPALDDFIAGNDLTLLETIRYDPVLGELNSNGLVAAEADGKYLDIFRGLLEKVLREVDDV